MSIPLFGEPLQTELPQRTLPLIARFSFSVMLILTLLIFMPFHFTPLIFKTSRLTLYRFTLHHSHAASPENQPDTLVFGFCRKADFPLMLSHLTLHHPPLFLLKLNLTSFISTLHHPHAASPENQTDTLVFGFCRKADFPLMLFFLMLHHPPLLILKLSPTSFISTQLIFTLHRLTLFILRCIA